MKKPLFTLLFITYQVISFGQNVFPVPSGNTGIGTATPSARLEINDIGDNAFFRAGINSNKANTRKHLINSMAVAAIPVAHWHLMA